MNTMTDLPARLQAYNQDGSLDDLILRARTGYYHDFKSPLACPKIQLVNDLMRHGLVQLAQEVKQGKFDE